MSLPIPSCPPLEGEDTVMLIIRLGNIFPLSHFRLISQIPPIKKANACVCACVCISLMQFWVLPRKHGPMMVGASVLFSWQQLASHGRFVVIRTISPIFSFFHTPLVISGHQPSPFLPLSFHFYFKT